MPTKPTNNNTATNTAASSHGRPDLPTQTISDAIMEANRLMNNLRADPTDTNTDCHVFDLLTDAITARMRAGEYLRQLLAESDTESYNEWSDELDGGIE